MIEAPVLLAEILSGKCRFETEVKAMGRKILCGILGLSLIIARAGYLCAEEKVNKSPARAEWLKITQAKYGRDLVAPQMKEKVVYYDKRHDSSGVRNLDELLTFLNSRGFITKDADELKSWMQEKITNGADGTVSIVAMGMVPDSITENPESQCTLKRYLVAGGRVIWIGDVPFYYQSYIDKASVHRWGKEFAKPGSAVFGIKVDKWNLHVDHGTTITEIGKRWGMQVVDAAVRPIQKESATLIFSEVSGAPYACSYFKNYTPEFPYSGFIRYGATNNHDGKNTALNNDLYRLALYRGKTIEVPEVVLEEKPETVEATTIETTLRNYPRGMSIPVTVRMNTELAADKVTLKIKDENETLREVSNPVNRETLFNLGTDDLASGDYVLEAELLKDNKVLAKTEKRISIVPKKIDKFPIGVYAVSGGSTEYKTDVILRDLKEHLGECGVTTGGSPNRALKFGLRSMGVSRAYYAGMLPRNEHPELHMRVSTGDLPKYHYGGKSKAPICMGNPINRERINEEFKRELRGDGTKNPAFMKRMFVSDDVGLFGDPEERLLACYCDYCKKEFKRLTGFETPLAPSAEVLKKKGVVGDKDPWYLWMKFRSNNTYGGWNRSLEKAKNEIDPEIKFGPIPGGGGSPVFNPQWALNPPDNYGGVGMVSYYRYPQRGSSLSFMSHSAAGMMGNRDKELWVIPQSSDFAGHIRDSLAQVRLVRNEFYYLLAAGAKGMIYFHYPMMPGTDAWEEFKNLSNTGTKFGPLVLKLKKAPGKVAVLASYCNASYHWAEDGGGGLPTDLYHSLLKSHLPVDMVADEEVLEDILEKYKVLILSNVDYLTGSVHQKIVSFIADGGTVLADKSCEIQIPGSETMEKTQGEITVSSAERIKKIIGPFVEVNTPHLIVSEFIGNQAKYLMLVNYSTDKATSGEVTLKGMTNYYLYDIFAGKEITDHAGTFNVTVEPAGGRLIGIYPAGIATVSVKGSSTSCRSCDSSFKIRIKGTHGKPVDALLPVRVSIKTPAGKESEYSDYYVAEAGRLDISFVPAVNDMAGKWEIEAKELSSGKSSKEYFLLE